MDWTKIRSYEYVNIKETLFSGQVFNFVQTDEHEYTGVVNNLLISFRQIDKNVEYRLFRCEYALFIDILSRLKSLNIKCPRTEDDYKKMYADIFDKGQFADIGKYLIIVLNEITEKTVEFFLGLDLKYERFIPTDLLEKHTGLRLVKNAIFPTIFSFICSQNNNIKRITKMVRIIYSKGEFACKYKDNDFFFFPMLNLLCDIEEELRSFKFGYRSSYISKTASMLLDLQHCWNDSDNINFEIVNDKVPKENQTNSNNMEENIKVNFVNRKMAQDKESIREILLGLTGVGPKVADCIMLMGFGFTDVVPIDTHIFKYALKTFDLKIKKLNSNNYKSIQNSFISKFGEHAGIVQLYIFKSYL